MQARLRPVCTLSYGIQPALLLNVCTGFLGSLSSRPHDRYWPIASFRCAAEFGRYRGIADIDQTAPDRLRDPWGNRIEIVGYENIQFTKAPNVLRGMGLTHLGKNDSATRELAKKGMAPE